MRLPTLVFAAMMLVGACATDTSVPTTVPDDTEPARLLAALADARAQWESAAPADYTVKELCVGCDERTVAVRSGEVLTLSDANQFTIEEVFSQIEAAIEEGARVQVAYDDDLGYPTAVVIDADRDGSPEIDLQYLDLESMPIVTTLDELLTARDRWETLGLVDYQYLFRAECTCSEQGTWRVTVIDGRVTEELPLDDDARQSRQIAPGSLDAAFDDLEAWFTDSAYLIEEGILEVDVRMDPHLGYPRWFRVVAEGLEEAGPFTERLEIIVTTELIGPVETVPAGDTSDREDFNTARDLWRRTGFADYRYHVEYYCECPEQYRGPFEITIRNGEFWQAVAPPGSGFDDAALHDTITIEQVFQIIERAINDRTDVDVTYDPVTGQPLDVTIDPEAVAVDGGLALSLTPLELLDPLGFLSLKALAGPQCPVEQSPPDPECADKPVIGAVMVLTRPRTEISIPVSTDENGGVIIALEPGGWTVTPQPVEGLLGTAAPVEFTIESRRTTELVASYDTGIR